MKYALPFHIACVTYFSDFTVPILRSNSCRTSTASLVFLSGSIKFAKALATALK